jgi:hypothetical protein
VVDTLDIGRIFCTKNGASTCHRLAFKFYHDPESGHVFTTCRKCLRKKDVKGGYRRISREEFVVRSVMES